MARRRKWIWTPEEEALLLRYYDGHREHLKRLYRRLRRFPTWVIRKKAGDLGLARHKEPRWTVAEEEFVERHIGTLAWKKMADKIGRTVVATKLHAKRMGLRKTKIGLTANSAARLLGCDIHKVTGWIGRGWLPSVRRGTDRQPVQGGDAWLIQPNAMRRLVIAHPEEIDLRRVDKLWFIDLMVGRFDLAGQEVSDKLLQKLDFVLREVAGV